MPLIEIKNLIHRFTDRAIGIDGVTLDIAEGAFVVIAGANGSGKTTLLRHLNGLLQPTSGSVRVAGLSVPDNLMRVRSQVGMVFQDADSQIVGETVYEDVAFGPENLKLSRAEVKSRVEDALSAAGLRHLAQKRPHVLSGGEKRRLAIAGILAMQPQVVVCDEPFASLDYPGVRQVLALLVQIHRQGRTVVVTTHDLDKVLAHAERLIVLRAGRVECDGPPGAVAFDLERYDVRTPRAMETGMEALSWLN